MLPEVLKLKSWRGGVEGEPWSKDTAGGENNGKLVIVVGPADLAIKNM